MTKPATYAAAGVDIDAANRATEKIKELARATFNARTLSEIGSFGGMFDGAFPEIRRPVLVASADGVGTKLKIAFATNTHNTFGQDLVNHCVNDILVQGARPLFFLDYIATGKLSPDVVTGIVAALLKPHLSYLPLLEGLIDSGLIKGLAHITGGGLLENIPRILPEGTAVQIRRGSWPVLPIFQLLQDMGKVEEAEMYRTFNMGIGMVGVWSTRDAAAIRRHSEQKGTKTVKIG